MSTERLVTCNSSQVEVKSFFGFSTSSEMFCGSATGTILESGTRATVGLEIGLSFRYRTGKFFGSRTRKTDGVGL